MVSTGYGQQLLRSISLFPLVVRSNPTIGDCKGYNQSHHTRSKQTHQKASQL